MNLLIDNPIIQTKIINNETFDLVLHQNKQIVIYKNKTYQNLNELIKDAPCLKQPDALESAVKIVNFMLYGLRYNLIEDVEDFRKKYLEKIHLEQTQPSNQNFRTCSFGSYDVGGIHPPRQERNHWIFFVENSNNGVPMRVTFRLPSGRKLFFCQYQLLPYQTND